MNHSPGETAVLNQVRVLYMSGRHATIQLKALKMQWPQLHYESYEKAFRSLCARGLIQPAVGQMFEITNAGLAAIGAGVGAAASVRRKAGAGPGASPAPESAERGRPASADHLARTATLKWPKRRAWFIAASLFAVALAWWLISTGVGTK